MKTLEPTPKITIDQELANELYQNDQEWIDIHKELLKENIVIRKPLSDRIREQVIKSNETSRKIKQ